MNSLCKKIEIIRQELDLENISSIQEKMMTDWIKTFQFSLLHRPDIFQNRVHINDLESFWRYAKENLAKHHGMNADEFSLYIKEMEWCFNNRNKNRFNILVDYLLEKSHIWLIYGLLIEGNLIYNYLVWSNILKIFFGYGLIILIIGKIITVAVKYKNPRCINFIPLIVA